MRWVTPGNVYFDQSLQASLVPVPYEEGLSWLPFSLSVLTSGFLLSRCSFLLRGIAIPDSPKWRVNVSNYCSTASISKAFVWRRSSKQTLKYFTTDLRAMLFFLLGEQTDADNTACQGSPGRLAVEPTQPTGPGRAATAWKDTSEGCQGAGGCGWDGICASRCTVTGEGSEAKSRRSQMGGDAPEKLLL